MCTMTNLQTPSRSWGKQKAKLKILFSHLQESDFVYEYGKKETMMANLQLKTGKTMSELNELITDSKKHKKSYMHCYAQ
jgi:phage-related protein